MIRRIANSAWTLPVVLVALQGLVAVATLHRPAWGDEEHFIDTVQYFAPGVTLERLKHYPEMSGPLPFLAYAAWGRLTSFELPVLRILSHGVALATYGMLYGWMSQVLPTRRAAVAITLWIAVNPYMIGMSALVFTDMLTIFAVLIACWAVHRERPILLFGGAAAALLCRQYMAFVTCGMGLYYAARWLANRDRRDAEQLGAIAAAHVPLGLLMLLWQGACPDSPLRSVYLSDGFRYHLSGLTLYVAQVLICLFPLVLLRWRTFYSPRNLLTAAVAGAVWYAFFPVSASAVAQTVGVDTVGLFHRLANRVLGPTGAQVAFAVCFVASLPVVAAIVVDAVQRWRRRDLDEALCWDLVIAAFFAIQPLSYLSWEKYFIPLVPLLAVRCWTIGAADVEQQVDAQPPVVFVPRRAA